MGFDQPLELLESIDGLDHARKLQDNTSNDLSNDIENQTKTTDIGKQVRSGDISTPIISILDSSKKLNTMTGILTNEILYKIVELSFMKYPDVKAHH